MYSIIVIDESAHFREYMRQKLEEKDIEVTVAGNALEGASKTSNLRPDLVILDYHLSQNGFIDVLRQKRANPHTAKIPVFVLARNIEQKKVIELIPHNVKKVLTKPVRIDALFAGVSKILGIPFKLDKNPGLMEVHLSDDIIFIEISEGLNEDKIDLLKFRITEMIELYAIRVPKVLLMFFNIKLTHADTPNMMKLFETVIHASRARPSYIRILTADPFTKKFIEGQEEYQGIVVADNIQAAMEGFLASMPGVGDENQKADIIGQKIFSQKDSMKAESLTLRFDAETKARAAVTADTFEEILRRSKIAAVDDDEVMLEQIKSAFKPVGAKIKTFSSGAEYLQALETEKFDLTFLDLIMPQVDGFKVLETMQAQGKDFPVIVLSSVNQRDALIRAFQMGIKNYLTKPMNPADLFKKAEKILKPGM
ncbi:two-component system response regulator [Spirochaetia bacterium]|nr:two-component system response regulator [Spirochaetia bacterium]